MRTNIFDLMVIALPALRPLRALRLLMMFRALDRLVGNSLRGRVTGYLIGSTALVLFCAALTVLDIERHHSDANITTLGDAFWWATTTVSTVGYGDHYPVTGEGRLVASLLMLGGIALLGMVTATLASWLVTT